MESVIRPWSSSDVPALAKHANNRRIFRNLRDAFPHPYSEADGRAFLFAISSDRPPRHLAIQLEGEAVGGIGMYPGADVERVSAEVGFWLSETYWGQGLTSRALEAFVPYAFEGFPLLHRLFAVPFLRNLRSQRVLEKNGFRREGILSESAIKDGVLESQAIYALTRPEWRERGGRGET